MGLDAYFIRGHFLTGSRLAGRLWTRAEEEQRRELLTAGIKAAAIACNLNRSIGAVYARVSALKKPRFGARSLPSGTGLPFRHQSGNIS